MPRFFQLLLIFASLLSVAHFVRASVLAAAIPSDVLPEQFQDAVAAALAANREHIVLLQTADDVVPWTLFSVLSEGRPDSVLQRALVEQGVRLSDGVRVVDVAMLSDRLQRNQHTAEEGIPTIAFVVVATVAGILLCLLVVLLGVWRWNSRTAKQTRGAQREQRVTRHSAPAPEQLAVGVTVDAGARNLGLDDDVRLRIAALGVVTLDDAVQKADELLAIDCPPKEQRAIKTLIRYSRVESGA